MITDANDVLGRGRGLTEDVVLSKSESKSCAEKETIEVAFGVADEAWKVALALESEDERDEKRRKRKKKKSKRQRSEERKERKRKQKEKKKRKRGHGSAAQWGKYGIIAEADIFNKQAEFHAWLVEERKINPETISKDQNRKEFMRYVEDFNTATLPHEKYYHMEAYERRMSALRQGEFVPPPDDAYDPQADLKAISGAHKKKVVEHESYLSKEQLQELRRVQQERIEAGKMKLLAGQALACLLAESDNVILVRQRQ
ncbi:hypothetical protein LshimejAT787_0409940 [Lyophyllum shimeji]|uniref:Uncharacterized protein n=1 Tax=Lyophyllum shimeji TaxID=47721 RepID=A0A9P3ULS5_LYOSH|nr:hypothetical protein LshimejAT787_0409940 [Lyophyllum shimeji]